MAATTTIPVDLKTATCPTWCISDHIGDLDDVRIHRSEPLTEGACYAAVTWREPLTATAHVVGAVGPMAYFTGNHGARQGVTLSARQAEDMARVMDALGLGDAAALLGRAGELLEGCR